MGYSLSLSFFPPDLHPPSPSPSPSPVNVSRRQPSPSKNSKSGLKGARAEKEETKTLALDNPFERKVNKVKHEVLGKKVIGDKGVPGHSKSVGLEQVRGDPPYSLSDCWEILRLIRSLYSPLFWTWLPQIEKENLAG